MNSPIRNSLRFKLSLYYALLISILCLSVLTSLWINSTLQRNLQGLRLTTYAETEQAVVRQAVALLLKDTRHFAQTSDESILLIYEHDAAIITQIIDNLRPLASEEASSALLIESMTAIVDQSDRLIARVQAEQDIATDLQLLDTLEIQFDQQLQSYAVANREQIDRLSNTLDQQDTIALYSIGTAFFVGLIILGVFHMISNALLKPVHNLSAALLSVGEGDFSSHLPTNTPSEFSALVESYYKMTNMLKRRQHALEDQLRHTSLLTQLSIELREALDVPAVIERVLRVVTANLGVQSTSVILVEADGAPRLALHMQHGKIHPISTAGATTLLDRGLAGWALRHSCSVVSSDIARDQRWYSRTQEEQTGSAMALPIRQAQGRLGVLTIVHPQTHAFTNRDLVLMEGIVAQLGVALSAALRYLDECQRREQALALLDISRFFTAEWSYQDLVNLLQEKSQRIFGAQHGFLFLGGEITLATVVSSQELAQTDTSVLMQQATTVAKHAWKTGEITTSDPEADKRAFTCIALPLIHNGVHIGAFVLAFAGQNAGLFSANMWSMLTIFTNVIGATCANMQLVAKLTHQTETLEALIGQRTHELKHSRDLLRVVFDNLPEGMLLLDAQDHVLAANNAFCQGITKRSPREVVGRTYATIWQELEQHGEIQIEHQGTLLSSSFQLDGTCSDATRVLYTDAAGQQRWFAMNRVSIVDKTHGLTRYLERWHDITNQEEIQRRLLFHEQLKSLGRLAVSVAHEVGTPLQSATRYLELCREETTLPTKMQDYLTVAYDELKRMTRTLDNLRNLYRTPQASWECVNINELLRQVQQFTARQFTHHDVTLQLTLDTRLPLIHGQSDALRQVFLNLLLNAQEAMPQGGEIKIATQWDQQNRHCSVCIRDSGVGMDKTQLMHLFEPFRSHKAQGVGLGLYLSKQIVDQHAGRIAVSSKLNEGTKIEIRLPTGTTNDHDVNDACC